MQIVFVCAEYPINERHTGGFGSYVKNIATALSKLGHLVTIICQGSEKKIIFEGNIEIRVMPTWIKTSLNNDDSLIRKTFFRGILFFQYPFWFGVQVYQELVQLKTSRTIDIIEGGDFGAELFWYLLFRKSAQPTVIIKLHTPSFLIRETNQERRTLFYKILERMEEFCVKKADALYSPSRSLAKIIRRKFKLKSSIVIPYPVRLSSNHIINTRSSKTVLFVGKIQRKKGVFVLAEAIEQVLSKFPKVKFLFVGPDTLEAQISTTQRLRKILKKHLRQVKFLPPLSQVEVARCYRRAVMTVVPSLWENYPNVILEAAMYGSPIVASATGGIPELITNHKTGMLVPPHNPQKLAEVIIQLVKNKKLRFRLARSARKFLQAKLNPEKIALRTLKFYSRFNYGK